MTRGRRRTAIYTLLVLSFISLAWIQSLYTDGSVIPNLFGDRTDSLLDIWVLCHTMFGAVQYGIWSRLVSNREHTNHGYTIRVFHDTICLSLISMCIWEGLEFSMELGLFGARVAYWKSGIEHWSNRFLADPFFGVLGCLICYRWPRVFWSALVMSIIWEIVQVLSPTSMSIQVWLFS